MKILHLTLKKKWFDMIASEEKKEEYREKKPYWRHRLFEEDEITRKGFTHVLFRNGYSKSSPKILVEIIDITEHEDESECIIKWGYSPNVFIIKLGKVSLNLF